jgi:hypothetical protein
MRHLPGRPPVRKATGYDGTITVEVFTPHKYYLVLNRDLLRRGRAAARWGWGTMRIEYTCEDGSKTLALWPSMALLHWLGRSQPTQPIENPEPFKLYLVGPPVPSDDHELFLPLVYAAIERRWNKTPPLDVRPPNRTQQHGGKEYQARCLEILRWLHAEGDITSLEVSSES